MDVTSEDTEDETLLCSLVYCSRAVGTLAPDEIERLVNAAQRRNAEQSVTGWLVYSNGIFFQWLEGPPDNVSRLMSSISADPRHDTIVVLSKVEEVRSRLFSGWDMELVSTDDIKAVLFDAIDASDDVNSTNALQSLLNELDFKSVGTGV